VFQNPQVRFLGINAGAFDAYKMNGEPLIADVKLALEALARALPSYKSEWGNRIEEVKKEWNAEVNRLYSLDDPEGLAQVRALGELNERLLPPDAVVVTGSGSIPSDMQRVWRTRTAGAYHVEYGFSCMGYEVAAALGVKIAEPEREVVALMGDGAYTMLHTELLTAVQEGRKIILVVLDNSGFHCIDNLQTSQGIARFGNEWNTRDPKSGRLDGPAVPVDYAKNAESWGALGLRAHNPAELRDAVEKALAAAGPVLIDVKVSPRSMTFGYESWWRVGTAQVSANPEVEKAAGEMAAETARARKF
jgi:3D-(3,5/4)-trihydroxycyclohexane-1,2-dione acylhydrolase (decyclizing)